ncbi:efflux RND transporter periplasmic adaptor subunit [Nitrospirillum pindoramense]|uniref:RND family efflux transporter MFP subunit n=1 Tax=Nitrospirillum amazonense TaxID=28077 RepID=A0A560GSX7_9PROT|nr:efflux RND transporter periplasmic adaptor subunit [Nitrospirillum amazonense]TWB36540.1 RND family efflux transporter MFP subunit [Nitrospirillum amazonense]
MSTAQITTPNPRRLALLGGVALLAAGAIVTVGLTDRARATRELVQWNADQAIPTVALAPLTRGAAQQALTLPGTLQAYTQAPIYARVSGYLKSWDKDIGAKVKAGDLLGTIDTPDLDQQLEQAKADLTKAEATARLADLTAKRWAALVASQSVSQQAADEKVGDSAAKRAAVESAAANVRRLEALTAFKRIVAPFDGVVTARTTDVGALINAGGGVGQELFQVSDLHRMRLYVQIPQAFASLLTPGVKATFDLPQYPGRHFDATLVTTANAVSQASRTMLVELQADNPDGVLTPGTFAEVHFQVPSTPGMVKVPATTLIPSDKGAEVAVVGPDGKALLKTVTIGRDMGDSVEIVAGLTPADKVIDNPPETLASGDPVRLAGAGGVTDKMADAASPAAPKADR